VILRNLPEGYEEGMGFGVIGYTIPVSVHSDTYNGQPLCYAGLAAQKNYCAVYLMGAYSDPKVDKALRDGFKKAGKKLDMGKSCIRFKSADDLPLDVIGRAVAALPPDAFIRRQDTARRAGRKKKASLSPPPPSGRRRPAGGASSPPR
jgi:hypothetical protein